MHESSRSNIPICNLHDELLFRSWDELISNNGVMNEKSRILTFNGRDISKFKYPKYIWHGSTNRGIRESSGYCDSWRQSNPANFGRVSPIGGNRLLAEHTLRCDEQAFIMCIKIREQRRSTKRGYGALRRRREVDRYAFDESEVDAEAEFEVEA